uniref:uncharacterized protein LOC109962575 isoform X2 n=1 Tax=Monopterus albus TaxID=43700 RepID=UPI0009B4431A|nr:uncharacterized protein LOC109962575 isoform X2 [Monopterus albus]
MSDCEETDFFWESWTSPKKKKRKKGKKHIKYKNTITVKTDKCVQKKKKKKKSKFKDAIEGGKERKQKERKNKKNKLSVGQDESFIFAQGYSGESEPVVKSRASNLCSTEKLTPDHLTQDSRKKLKRKKKVVFDLSPGYMSVKRPKFVSSYLQDNILPGKDSEHCSQVTVMGLSQGQRQDSDSQCTSDINSQDLFITQKTFVALPSEPSSGEASDKADTTALQKITQQESGQYSSVVQIKHHEGSNPHLWDHFHQHPRKAKEHLHMPETVTTVIKEEDEEEEKQVSGPVHVKPSIVNPYLDDPVVVNWPMHVSKSKKHSCKSSQQSPLSPVKRDKHSLLPQLPTASISTQTENFFTTELCSYLNFCQKTGVTGHFEGLKPLDLSLPFRARNNLGRCLSGIHVKVDEEKSGDQKPSCLPEGMKVNGHRDPNLRLPCSSDMKGAEVKPCGQQPCSVSTQGKDETTSSLQSEPKSADTTTSGEDEPPCRIAKLYPTQGEGQSPRPESPLMKLVQGREMKSRKSH